MNRKALISAFLCEMRPANAQMVPVQAKLLFAYWDDHRKQYCTHRRREQAHVARRQ